MERTFFTIYNQRLAGYLMQNGFTLIRIVENKQTGKNNYIFVNTPLMHEFIDKWQMQKVEMQGGRK